MERWYLGTVLTLVLSAGLAGAQQVHVREEVLPNGMKLLMVERHDSPTVACGWVARVGSVNEAPGITGISHLFEHMMFKGTTVGRRGAGWVALINAGANAPQASDTAITQDEPPPSLGGFAVTDDPAATTGWRFLDAPIERIDEIPPDALANGEGTNLWRHHLLALPDGRRLIFYNSGAYAREQLFAKLALD